MRAYQFSMSVACLLSLMLHSSANAGIVVGHDVNTLSSSEAGANEQQFAVNVATFLTGGATGELLLFESGTDTRRNFAPGVVTALSDAGFTVTVTGNYATSFAMYDAIFVSQEFPEVTFLNNQAMINFVNAGGGVYLAGGVGSPAAVPPLPDAGAAVEAAGWATFLNEFGLAFGAPYNNLLSVPITSSHPIFTGVTSLKSGIGNPIISLGTNPNAHIVQSAGGGGVYAVVDTPTAVPEPSSIILLGVGAVTLCGFGRRRRQAVPAS